MRILSDQKDQTVSDGHAQSVSRYRSISVPASCSMAPIAKQLRGPGPPVSDWAEQEIKNRDSG